MSRVAVPKVMKPFEPIKLEYGIQDLFEMDAAGKLKFDISIQRGLKWKNTKQNNSKSMLILSILLNSKIGQMIYNCVFTDSANKKYEVIDGKQREDTIFSFMRDEYVLKYLPLYQIGFGDNQEIIDLNGKTFSKLPKKLQEKIRNFKPEVYYHENLSKEDKAYIFGSTNSGMPLTSDEKAKAEIKDQDVIVALADHELMDIALTFVQLNAGSNEAIVKNTWGILNVANVAFLADIFVPIISNAKITLEQQAEITKVFDKLLATNTIIRQSADKTKDKKEAKRLKSFSKKFLKRLHIPSLAPVVKKSIFDGVSDQELTKWIYHFFGCDKATISEDYNKASIGGTASAKGIKIRADEAMKDYCEFMNVPFVEPILSVNNIQYYEVEEVKLTSQNTLESIQTPIETDNQDATNEQQKEPESVPETKQEDNQQEQQMSLDDQSKENEAIYNQKQKDHYKKK